MLKKTKLASKEENEHFQFLKIKELITHAYESVPYYKASFDAAGFKPDQFNSLADMDKLPVLNKDLVRENQEKLISQNFPKKYLKAVWSGGTTGLPVAYYLDSRTSTPVEMAYLEDIWGEVGFRLYDKIVVLRGETFQEPEAKGRYWRMNYLINWLSMSTYHLTADNFTSYYQKFQKFKPKFIVAYPSIMMNIVKILKEKELRLPDSVKGVICSSESLFPSHKEYMESYLNIPVITYYGLSEKCCIAKQGVNSDSYEFYPRYGYVELLDENNKIVSKPGERGEITATSLNNFGFPFIRYKTGDIGILNDDGDKKKGSLFSLKRIEGRKQEYFVDKSGNHLPFAYADTPIWPIHLKINAYQYFQDKPGLVILYLSEISPITAADKAATEEIFYEAYRNLVLEFKIVPEIERTSSGKFRYLIQKLT